jgi:hypothetical protein
MPVVPSPVSSGRDLRGGVSFGETEKEIPIADLVGGDGLSEMRFAQRGTARRPQIAAPTKGPCGVEGGREGEELYRTFHPKDSRAVKRNGPTM